MRIVFFATGDIALPALNWAARSSEHDLCCLVTQPDKPVGRRQILIPPPPKLMATDFGIPVLQPEKIRNPAAIAEVAVFAPEVIVVMAYGQILPCAVLDMPTVACLNLHASLLPLYRGAAPIQAAIQAGDAESGITVMYMAEGLDTGDILLKKSTPLRRRETGGSLHDRLAELAVPALAGALELLAGNAAPRVAQDDSAASHVAKLTRESARIDWSCGSGEIERMIRAMNPWPAASTMMTVMDRPRNLKIFAALSQQRVSGRPGEILRADERGILVACGQGGLLLKEVQLEGKRRMRVGDFLRGRSLAPGTQLGG